ncbi:hypothetical protein CRG98_019351 [Punica granatum]|uniref:Uncharacterized protein n=1 Tax=Punica granatum TaxID=22663 RepID=A0A2I0JXV9_PUNGR|nr:hypothetical protein CRG98_019351 [Punica granatum]
MARTAVRAFAGEAVRALAGAGWSTYMHKPGGGASRWAEGIKGRERKGGWWWGEPLRMDLRDAHPERDVDQAVLTAVSRALSHRRCGSHRREPPSTAAGVLSLAHPCLLRSPSLTGSTHLYLICVGLAQPIRPNPFSPVQSNIDDPIRSDVRPAPSHSRLSPERAAQLLPFAAQLPFPTQHRTCAPSPVCWPSARPVGLHLSDPSSAVRPPHFPFKPRLGQARIPRIRYIRGPTPSLVNHGVQCPQTPSACNLSAESGLVSTYCFALSSVYVEDDLDRASKSRLDMTWELDRSHGYQESHMALLPSVGSVGPDPRLFEPALL